MTGLEHADDSRGQPRELQQLANYRRRRWLREAQQLVKALGYDGVDAYLAFRQTGG